MIDHRADGVYAYRTYAQAISGQRLPLAFCDLNHLEVNVRAIGKLAQGCKLRIATKSIRCVELLKRIHDGDHSFQGVMAYSALEAAYLAGRGFDDILIAYPTMDALDLEKASRYVVAGRSIYFMVDAVEHAQLLSSVAERLSCRLSICLDIDLSNAWPGLFFGVRRSPLKSVKQALELSEAIHRLPHLDLIGVMGYEAQLAGVPDDHPQFPFRSRLIRCLKRFARRHAFELRHEIVRALEKQMGALKLVNGGGTGSLSMTRGDPSITELTAGSGFYAPQLFDYYTSLNLKPAVGFALPLTRRPTKNFITCHGGGYVASGAFGKDRLPTPYLPAGLSLLTHEGAGEVQTPLAVDEATYEAYSLHMGAPIFFRHAKAGEICEHFNELHLIKDGTWVGTAKTYRGDGQAFL